MNQNRTKSSDVERVDPAKYDRLKPWRFVQEEISRAVATRNPEDEAVVISEGIQLLRDLRHGNPLKFVTVVKGNMSSVVIAAYKYKSINVIISHRIAKDSKQIKTKKFEITQTPKECVFASTQGIFVCVCAGLMIRVFSNISQGFKELSCTYCLSTVQVLAYNKDMEEIIGGGPGLLLRWSLADYRKALIPLEGFENLEISRDTWIRKLEVNTSDKVMTILTDEEVIVYKYINKAIVFNWPNKHAASLAQTIFYAPYGYLMTAGRDGTIKVGNSLLKVELHDFRGHLDTVTGMAVHSDQPLLFSCSLDGTIRAWQLEILEPLYCWHIGEPIHGMELLDSDCIICWTEQSVKVFSLDLHLQLFASRQSEIVSVFRATSNQDISRIIVSTEDGSISLLSPATGRLITSVYPSVIRTYSHIVHDLGDERLYTLHGNGHVMVFDTSSNPSQPDYRIVPKNKEDMVLCLAVMNFKHMGEEYGSIVLAGNMRGAVVLLYAVNLKFQPQQAHQGDVIVMETCHDLFDGLLTGGADKVIRLWRCLVVKKTMTLSLVASVSCKQMPSRIAMVTNVIVHSTGSLLKMKRISEKKHGREWKVKSVHLFPEDQHIAKINGLATCTSQKLLVTTAYDGFVKIWNTDGHIVRELALDATLNGVTFANNRGDIIVGYRGHLYSMGLVEYLPYETLENMEKSVARDEIREEPLEVQLALETWFEYEELKTFPPEAAAFHDLVTRKVEKVTDEGDLSPLLGGIAIK